MDEWRQRLIAELLGDPPRGDDRPTIEALTGVSGPTAMEIALGKVRSELTYVLELGRAHHLPLTGNVVGDDVWMCLGDKRLAFHFDRIALRIVAAIANREETAMTWDPRSRSIVTSQGNAIDVEWFVRDAIDATVKAWKSK